MMQRALVPALLALLTIGLPALAAPMAPTRYRLAFPDSQPGTPLDEAVARTWREWLGLLDYDVAGYCAAESELELIRKLRGEAGAADVQEAAE